MADVQPNRAHHAIVELEKMGKLSSVITQNVDNLHQKAGNSSANSSRIARQHAVACLP